MSDEQEKDSPSADEIVDDMAADMGVEDESVPEESGGGAMDGLGGIFDVPASSKRKKKKKKKKKKKEEPSEASGESEKSKKPKKPKRSAKEDLDDLAGVLTPSSDDTPIDDLAGGDYLGEDDLDGYGGGSAKKNLIIGLVVLLAVGGLGFVFVTSTDTGGDMLALFQGDLREKRLAEADQKKKEWEAEQEAALEKYGTLNISGSPKYAVIKLDGKVHYGQTSSGAWRDLHLGQSSAFNNLKVKQKHEVEVDAPGFDPETYDLTEGRWDENSGTYTKMLTINLAAESAQHDLEYQQRMDTSDTETEYYGEVTISSVPSGAKVEFNNYPLLDKDGEELTTPVTFDKFYVEDEDSGKLEEREIDVDTPPDRGHKIVLKMPEDKGEYPEYITALQRRMWTCEWKDGDAPDSPPQGKTYRDLCNYKYTLDMDFDGLKEYIKEREEEKKRVEERNAKLRAKQEEAAKAEAEGN
ncbi:MAG: hypothetical protein ACLFVJ_12255 [Persicimonas sp.]